MEQETYCQQETATNTSSSVLPSYRIYYNDVYRVDLPPRHRFPMNKYEQVRKLVQKRILGLPSEEQEKVQSEFHVSPLATFEELATTHSEEYIQRFLNGKQTQQEQRDVGFPWSQQGVQRALSSVGGTLAASCYVCDVWSKQQRRQQNQEPQFVPQLAPWGAHLAGGTHHAFYDYGEGFSVFSDIAVAANVVLQRYPQLIRRILIIDLDVHQGNGNAVLFQDNPNVVTFSIQCEGNYFSQKQSSDLDIELPIDCNDQTYLATLNFWLNRIYNESQQQEFDMIFFQAGVDILEDDRLGRMNLSPNGVKRRNQLVYEFAYRLNKPFVICMGGGYPRNNDDWTTIIEAHANVYCQARTFLAEKANDDKISQ